MSVKYQDCIYASDRICGSVVLLKGSPVYVNEIHEDGFTLCQDLRTQQHQEIDSYHELDLTPVTLGNVNYRGVVQYASRIPKRRDWRQGLRDNNLSVVCVGDFTPYRASFCGINLVKTIMGFYPSLQECAESIVNEEVMGMAFSRNFSLHNKGRLFFRCVHVGEYEVVSNDNIQLRLDEDYIYLDEMLKEEVRHAA